MVPLLYEVQVLCVAGFEEQEECLLSGKLNTRILFGFEVFFGIKESEIRLRFKLFQ